MHDEALIRLKEIFRNRPIKLLVCYRDPVDAIGSLINYRMMRGIDDADRTPREIIADHWETVITRRFYDVHLERLLQFFPREAIHVMRFEEMVAHPDRFFRTLYDFLDIASSDLHRSVTAINASRRYRSRMMQQILSTALSIIKPEAEVKRLLRRRPKDQPWWLRVLQQLNTRQYIEFDPQLRQELHQLFAPHMRNLERMLAKRESRTEFA